MTTLEAQQEVITNLILENKKLKQECEDARDEWGKASMDAAQLLSEKTKVIAERDELQDILRKLLEIIPEPECHDFGHTKEERHAFLERCPVMDRYDALITKAREAAKWETLPEQYWRNEQN